MPDSQSKAYQLFGRQSFGDPLSFVERIEVSAGEPLIEKLRNQAGRSKWVELVALPEASILTVIDEGSPR